MQAHMRKHHIEKNMAANIKEEETVDWRSAFTDLIYEFTEAGAALRGFRMREGLTQKELAETVGIAQANLSKMERGKRLIGRAMAKKFASFFHTDYRIFL